MKPRFKRLVDGSKNNPFLAWTKNRIRRNKNVIMVVNGETGCLSGDTEINVNRMNLGRRYTLKKMYYNFRQIPHKNQI